MHFLNVLSAVVYLHILLKCVTQIRPKKLLSPPWDLGPGCLWPLASLQVEIKPHMFSFHE